MIAFGPVPSRRLGHSLGINNIPPKICSYACGYCQLGNTIQMQIDRRPFYKPQQVYDAVESQVRKVRNKGETINYLTFVPDGEPTLDINLGHTIVLLKPLGIKIAIISNASLIWHEDVQHDLASADWISLKVDATDPTIWHKLDRPHGKLQLDAILEGILTFARNYQGVLVTETMLVAGVNDSDDHLRRLADFFARVNPSIAYLAIPTRPPAEVWVQPPDESRITRAYHIFRKRLKRVEYLIGYEGNAFAYSGNVMTDLLNITAVHPMREDAVQQLLNRANSDWSVVQKLINNGQLVETTYQGKRFYMRKLQSGL